MSGFDIPYFVGSTIQGRSWSTYTTQVSGSGLFACFQLWNPTGSGIKCVVNGALMYNPTAAVEPITVSIGSAQLTGTVTNAINKNSAGGTPHSSVTQAAVATPPASNWLSQYYLPPNLGSINYILPDDAIVITPGNGLMMTCTTSGAAFNGAFDWVEIPV
jgi:hypothetical protein